jgi:hypothetical protein
MNNFSLTLFAKYNLNNQVKGDVIGRTRRRNGEKRNAYRVLVRKARKEITSNT